MKHTTLLILTVVLLASCRKDVAPARYDGSYYCQVKRTEWFNYGVPLVHSEETQTLTVIRDDSGYRIKNKNHITIHEILKEDIPAYGELHHYKHSSGDFSGHVRFEKDSIYLFYRSEGMGVWIEEEYAGRLLP